jgi:hypothetical protein
VGRLQAQRLAELTEKADLPLTFRRVAWVETAAPHFYPEQSRFHSDEPLTCAPVTRPRVLTFAPRLRATAWCLRVSTRSRYDANRTVIHQRCFGFHVFLSHTAGRKESLYYSTKHGGFRIMSNFEPYPKNTEFILLREYRRLFIKRN